MKDEELKRQLYRWSRTYESLKEEIETLRRVNTNFLDFIRAHGSLRNVDRFSDFIGNNRSILDANNLNLLKDPAFENALDDKLFTSRDTNKQYHEIRELIEQILESIPVH